MNKFKSHLIMTFYDYFKDEIPSMNKLAIVQLKRKLEYLLGLCNAELELRDDRSKAWKK